MLMTTMREFYDDISKKALNNCSDEFQDLARYCAIALATYKQHFDGSQLTDLMQRIKPDVWPRPDESLIGFYRNTDKINLDVTMARQRNYFTSAANLYLPIVSYRGGKVPPARKKTHDKVCIYTSRIYGQTEIPVDPAVEEIVKGLA